MKLLKTLLIIIVFGYSLSMSANANSSKNKMPFLASFSGSLQKGLLSNNQIEIIKSVMDQQKFQNIYWPVYNLMNNLAYFEATENLDQQGVSTNVYQSNLFVPDEKTKRIIRNAKYPSLSPNGRLLAFYRHPNQLWVYNFKDKIEKKIIDNIMKIQPCVWISNDSLLFYDMSNKMIQFNLLTEEKQETGQVNIIPGALSPDQKIVLCGSSDGKRVFSYSPISKKINLLKENKYCSIGSSFIWLADGSGFLFTQQVWSNILKFNESRDLFVYVFNGGETHLLNKIALFGGVSFQHE